MTPDEALLHDWIQDGKAKIRPLPKYKPPGPSYTSGSTSVLSGYSHSSLPHTKEHVPPVNHQLIHYQDFKTGKVVNDAKQPDNPVPCGKVPSDKELGEKGKLEISKETYQRHNTISIPQASLSATKVKKDFGYHEIHDLTKVSHNEGRRYSFAPNSSSSQKDFTQSLQKYDIRGGGKKDYRYGEFDVQKKEPTAKKDYSPLGPVLSGHNYTTNDYNKSRPPPFSQLPRLSSNKEI